MTDHPPQSSQTVNAQGSWKELLGRRYRGSVSVLSSGVAIYATNEFLTISLLPSAVKDIGNERLYSWVTTLYLVGSVLSSAAVNIVLQRLGTRLSYLVASVLFGAGSVICACAPRMEILLIGRVLQGVGGGLLAGLSYALISTILPSSLWTRASGLISAMWGIGTFLGPALGGIFAQLGYWRWAFGLMGAVAVIMFAMAMTSLVNDTQPHSESVHIPLKSLVLLGCSALTVSIAQLSTALVVSAVLLVVSGMFFVGFLYEDRRSCAQVLPPSVYRPGQARWIYLTLGILMATTKANVYIPLLGQRLAHLGPLMAGFLGAALSTGWTFSEVASASLSKLRLVILVVLTGPLVMSMGLAVVAFFRMSHYNPNAVGAIWALALLAIGAGAGAVWPHLSAWAIGSVDDPIDSSTAAAAINTVELIGGAFGAGLAGLVVNTALAYGLLAAKWLFAIFALFAVAGCPTSYYSTRLPAVKPHSHH